MLPYIQAYTCLYIYIYHDNDVIIIFIYKYGFVCTIHTKKACVYIYTECFCKYVLFINLCIYLTPIYSHEEMRDDLRNSDP